ncbi:uncharacterized protein LOC124655781 [Lolium rigidum]|uniref:uncharacterized protein LOC124655781 n=1 Tax=Lolium rigidum TaxID=89674 RepID=UPI001F5D3CCC|nr:uncharacterized protein LOC124655781 [Lolium rigidum]
MTTHKPISYHLSVIQLLWSVDEQNSTSLFKHAKVATPSSFYRVVPPYAPPDSAFIGVDCRPGRASFAGRNPYCELEDRMENIQGQERYPTDVNLLKAAREGNTQLLEQLLDEELPSRLNHIVVSVPTTSFGSSDGGIHEEQPANGQGGHGEASTSRHSNNSPSMSGEVTPDGGRPPPEHIGELSGRLTSHRHVSLTPFVSKLLQGVTSDLDVVLHIAAKLGHVDLVRAISMREGLVVNVPAKNKRGETPLHCAAANGNVDMIDLLILMAGEVGAMQLLSERNHNGETCLHEAVRCGNIEAAKRLVMADVAVQHYRDICKRPCAGANRGR